MAELSAPAMNYFRLPQIDGGVVYGKLPYKLESNQSPDMQNMLMEEKLLCKRRGIQSFMTLGSQPDAAYADFDGYLYLAAGTKLLKVDYQSFTATELYTTMQGTGKGTFFAYNDRLYYINGTDYIWTDGQTAEAVTPYVPLWLINCNPLTGAGDEADKLNRLSAGFRVRYSAEGTVSTVQLPGSLLPLDAAAVTVTVAGAVKTENTDFTVNRTTGVLTVTGDAWQSGVNHIEVTASRTDEESEQSIRKCRIAMAYGGDASGLDSGTRVFMAGNPDEPGAVFYSDLLNPAYFPDDGYIYIGADDEGVTAFGKQYDLLYVFKPRSIYSIQYTMESGKARFVQKEVNAAIGCDMPGTVQLISNALTFCNTYGGVYTLASTVIRDERNVMPLSGNINAELLAMDRDELRAAASADFGSRYWLCIGDRAFVWDYGITPYYSTGNIDIDAGRLAWFPQKGVSAALLWSYDGVLYFARRSAEGGAVDGFANDSLVDYGSQPIEAWYRSADWCFDASNIRKTIEKLWFTVRTFYYSEYDITYYTDRGEKSESRQYVVSSFNWERVTWPTWTWNVLKIAYTLRAKAKMKKCVYFGVRLENKKAWQDLTVSDLVIQWSSNGEAK